MIILGQMMTKKVEEKEIWFGSLKENLLFPPFVLHYVVQFLIFVLKTVGAFFVADLDQLCLTDCQAWVH